jgi:hypothetical protein
LGNEFAKLTLSFPNGNRFHAGTLIFGTKSCKRLDAAEQRPLRAGKIFQHGAHTKLESTFSMRFTTCG